MLLVTGLVFYFSQFLVKEELSSKAGTTPTGKVASVKFYVENCYKKTLKEGVESVALNGGYFKTIDNSSAFYQIPYYFYLGIDLSPSKETVEQQLSEYVEQEIIDCTQNFSLVSHDLTLGKVSVNTTLGENSISSKMYWPIKINLDGSETEISSFSERVDVRMGLLYNTAKNITWDQTNRTGLCISCLSDLAENNNIHISVDNLYNDEVVIILSDKTKLLNPSDEYFQFVFAFKYPEENFTLTPEEAVKLMPIENLNVTIGNLFQYQVKATGKGLIFWDQTDLFNIDSVSGLIRFTPTEKQAGNHTIWIYAKNRLGSEDFTTFNLEVLK